MPIQIFHTVSKGSVKQVCHGLDRLIGPLMPPSLQRSAPTGNGEQGNQIEYAVLHHYSTDSWTYCFTIELTSGTVDLSRSRLA